MKISWQYIAGLVDGEGCIQLIKAKQSWYPVVTITQKNKGFLNLLKQEISLGTVSRYNYTIAHRQATKFLQNILPYLIIKKDEAELLLYALYLLKNKSRRYNYQIIENTLLEIAETLKLCHLQ